ncbi:MAG: hypothetical protein OSB33_05480 [Candidatus Poseidoniales archaeon]|nr:hypothetical protein [Candidatus Poseidoniales archaeon]
MGKDEGAMTLVGRQETHGRRYPSFAERLSFLITIVTAVLIGRWVWIESDWSGSVLWPVTVCGLPLGALLLGEMLARVIQRIHVNGD